jgi:hypothetical protein
MSKYGRLPVPIIPNEEPKTNPAYNIGIINPEQKKKPHNVTIKNHNPREPKINANTKYSAKQSYRRYKTKTEPNLFNKIQVNEDDDIVSKIREAFGIAPDKPNTNYSEVETAPSPYNKGVEEPPAIEPKMRNSDIYESQPIPLKEQGQMGQLQLLLDDFNDVSIQDAEDLTFQPRISNFGSEYEYDTDVTPIRRMSRREMELDETDFGTEPENRLTVYASTPTAKQLLNRLSSEMTPLRLMTPDQKKIAHQYIQRLSGEKLNQIAEKFIPEEFITERKKRGRPSGPYGKYNKKTPLRLTNGPRVEIFDV